MEAWGDVYECVGTTNFAGVEGAALSSTLMKHSDWSGSTLPIGETHFDFPQVVKGEKEVRGRLLIASWRQLADINSPVGRKCKAKKSSSYRATA